MGELSMQLGFFGIDDKCEKPTGLGDPLVKVNKPIDFTMFGDIHCQDFCMKKCKKKMGNYSACLIF